MSRADGSEQPLDLQGVLAGQLTREGTPAEAKLLSALQRFRRDPRDRAAEVSLVEAIDALRSPFSRAVQHVLDAAPPQPKS